MHKFFLNQNNIAYCLVLFFPIFFQIQSISSNVYLALLFLIFLINKNNIRLLVFYKHNSFEKMFLIFIAYGIFISFFHENTIVSLLKNFLNIRFLLLILIIKIIFDSYFKIKLYIIVNFFILSLLQFDVFYQFLVGVDIFGYGIDPNHNRISAYFNDEYVVGSFLVKFFFISLLIFNFVEFKNINIKKTLFSLLLIITGFCIFLTGERTAFGEFIILFSIFFVISCILKKNFNNLWLVLLSFSLIFLFIYIFRNDIRVIERYFQIYEHFTNPNMGYLSLYLTSLEIIKNNFIFGAGSNGFSIYCSEFNVSQVIDEGCSSHSHNYLIDHTVEQGIFGLILLLSLIYFLFKSFYEKGLKNYNEFVSIDALIIGLLIIYFFPFKPTNSIFASTYGAWIWFNVGILIAINNLKEKFS